MARLVKIIVIGALTVFGFGQYISWSNKDMTELTEVRRTVLKQVQPVLLRYKADTGRFPAKLEMLVPQYLPEVPDVLRNIETEVVKQIRYEPTETTALFIYHVIRGPDSTEIFDVVTGSFEQNP